jgi:hypothetical protein
MKNKSASLETKEILELILAAAGIFILLFLFFKLFAPTYDPGKEAAKSYLDTFKQEIAKADKGQTGEFSFWQNSGTALVYFGARLMYTTSAGVSFEMNSIHKNYICMCYNYYPTPPPKCDGGNVELCKYIVDNSFSGQQPKCDANYCLSLGLPAKWEAGNNENFVLTYPTKFQIIKQTDSYLFKEVK